MLGRAGPVPANPGADAEPEPMPGQELVVAETLDDRERLHERRLCLLSLPLEGVRVPDDLGGVGECPVVSGGSGQRPRLFERAARSDRVGERQHRSDHVESARCGRLVAVRLCSFERLLGVGERALVVAGVGAEVGARPERPRHQLGVGRRGERARVRGLGLREAPAQLPPHGQRDREPQRRLRCDPQPVVERGREVRGLGVEHVEQPELIRGRQLRRDPLGQLGEVGGVALAHRGGLAGSAESLQAYWRTVSSSR